MEDGINTKKELLGWAVSIAVVIVLIFGLFIGINAIYKKYNIWSKEQRGRATLAEAQFSKQVKLEEAKTNLESEKLNAQAEIERAKGASESIAIESGKLTENYIRYLWVRQQGNLNDKTVIYIPTEAGLPLLEAGQR